METTAHLTVREYEESDFPSVQRLWREDAEWGDMTPEKWRRWYVEIPHGPAPVIVAVDGDGEVRGLTGLTPHEAAIGDEIVRGYKLAANIVSKNYRGLSQDLFSHPFFPLVEGCRQAVLARGEEVLFGMPRSGIIGLLRKAEEQGFIKGLIETFKCLELDLKVETPDTDYTARAIERYSDEHEALWASARKKRKDLCGMHRSASALNYRNGGYRNYELRTPGGELVGYGCLRADGLLFDFVAADTRLSDDLVMALVPAARALKAEKLKVLAANYFEDLESRGFAPVNFQFGFVGYDLKGRHPIMMKRENWHLAGGG